MAYSYVVYTGNGSTTQFAITFPYIRKEHVKVYVNYVDTAYTYVNDTTVQLAAAPASSLRVEVRRVTPLSTRLVDYTDGSTLVAADLDTSNLQSLYNEQELDDSLKQTVSIDPATGLPSAGGQRITNVGNPTSAQDAATKSYVDTADALKVNKAGDSMSGALAMGTNKITGLGNPTSAQDGATKTYVDTADALKVAKAGDSMTGPLAMGTNKVTGMGDPTSAQDAATKTYVDTADALKVAKAGDSMTGALAMGSNKITGLGTPTANADAATKAYVDAVTLAGNVPDGDRGDITVSGVGTSWTIDTGAVVEAKLGTGAVTSAKILDGTILNADVNATAGIAASKLSFTQAGASGVARTVDSKLKDVVSVKDFGAVGDGTVDDTAAISAALATGKTVYFPQGTYMTTGAHVIGTNGQGIIGDGPWESIIKKLSGTSELLRVARLTNGCFVRELGFDCNALAGTGIRWKSHYSVLSDVRITNGVNNQWGLHLTGVNVSRFEGLTIEETGGCILIDQNNDTDPAVGYSTLYTKFRDINLVPKNTQALKIQGQAQDIVFDGLYVETASTVVPNPPAIILSSGGPITDIHFYNIGCEHNVLQSTFIDIVGTNTAQNDIYNIVFRGGRLTAGFAGQDKPLIRANKVNNLIVDGLLFYCDQNLVNRPHIEIGDCTNVKVANNSVYSYPNDFIFIKDTGGCSWVTDDTNTRIRINASGGNGTNQWGLTGASSNITSINSGMSQSFTNAAKVTSTDYQLAPSIRAYRNSAGGLAHNTATKWAFSTVDAGYDPSGCYNTSTYRFTPTVKGFYAVTMKGVIGTGGANLVFSALIYKNGSVFSSAQDGGTGGTNAELSVVHNDLVYMDGTTDYLEGYFYQYDFTSGSSRNIVSGASLASYFVRSV